MPDEQYYDKVCSLMHEAIILIQVNSFVPGYQATPEECAGLVLSKYFEWSGESIMKAAYEALEDANFHTEASVIELLLDAEDSRALAQEIFEAH